MINKIMPPTKRVSSDIRRIKTAVMHMHRDLAQYGKSNCSDLTKWKSPYFVMPTTLNLLECGMYIICNKNQAHICI
jgi:hypothetical protein